MTLRGYLVQLGESEVDALLPSVAESRDLDRLLLELRDMNAITLELQRDDLTVADVLRLFDTVIEQYPSASPFLSSSAAIVQCVKFEIALSKILDQSSSSMSECEQESVGHLTIDGDAAMESTASGGSIVERSKRRVKKQTYLDCRFIVPTSNMCEHFFSSSKFALTDRRRSILPRNFEAQMFLHVNRDLWDLSDVSEALASTSLTSRDR
ncbi:hypothetical protein LEN26_008900 [Aphanomyces euteiches]|nr:hypothetical protein AeMF1_004047 [Aphanomyces euteiches]KAH9130055.1 hypothetical protein LEN26_008900 [Aphanomyces euteiches]